MKMRPLWAWPDSIRRRLMLGLALSLSLVLGLALLINYGQALNVANQAFDQGLLNSAVALAARIELDSDNDLDVDLPWSAQAILQTDTQDQMHFAVTQQASAGPARLVWGEERLLLCLAASAQVPSPQTLSAPGRPSPPVLLSLSCEGQNLRLVRLDAQGPDSRAVVLVAETLRKREAAAREILKNSAALGLTLWAAALLTVYLVTRQALRPLERLAQQIEQRAPADLQALPEQGQAAELRTLLRAMNAWLMRLQSLAQAQRSFVNDVAHQLRTPLAGLSLQLELARQDPGQALSEARQERIDVALARMRRMVDKLLSRARTNAEPSLQEPLQRLDLRELAEQAANDFFEAASRQGVSLQFELASAPVQGRVNDLQDLLSNLLDNALMHAQARQVWVRCGRCGAEVFLELEDDGVGMSQAQQQHLFERFRRGEGSAGTGLGLAIVHTIAAQHGGRVELLPAQGRQGQPDQAGKTAGCRLRLSLPAGANAPLPS